MAMTKRKGLEQQQDSLQQQSLANKSSELERAELCHYSRFIV